MININVIFAILNLNGKRQRDTRAVYLSQHDAELVLSNPITTLPINT